MLKRSQIELFRRVEDLALSVRPLNCLKRMNLVYVGDLVQKTEAELLSAWAFGRKSLGEVKACLAEMGLNLGMKIASWETRCPNKIYKEVCQEVSAVLNEEIKCLSPEIDLEGFIKLFRKVDELDLSVRSARCFRDQGITYVGDLVQKTQAELLGIRNFGRKSLAEINSKLHRMGLSLGMQVSRWPPDDIEEELRSLEAELEEKRLGEAKEAYEKAIPKITCLEDELSHLANLARSQRDMRIVIRYFGWDGSANRTYEAVGNEFGITRERVRQIIVKFHRRIRWRLYRSKRFYTPIIDRALEFVSQHTLSYAKEIESQLAAKGISKKPFRLEGVETVAELLGRKLPLRIVRLRGIRIAVKSEVAEIPKLVVSVSRKAIEHWGVTTVADVVAQVEEKTNHSVDIGFATTLLALLKDFRLIDESGGWFWLSSVSRNRLLNQIRKILSVADQIHISELRSGVGRHYRMKGVAPPRRVLLEFCRMLPWCHVEGHTITSDPPLNWDEVLNRSSTEWAMAAILKEHGPVMSRQEFEDKCLELGMKPMTFSIYLAYSPIITKHAIGVYGLRGSDVAPGVVESLKPKKKPTTVLKDFGWTNEGEIWIAHRLSSAMIRSGVFAVPASMRKFLQGTFSLRTADGALIGNLNIKDSSGWSLGSFFRRRGGETGDYLVLVFHLTKRQVVIHIGDQDLLDDFQPEG